MTDQFDIQAAIAQAATQAPNMAEASKGGGGTYTPPNKGKCVAILVGYVEIGRHKKVHNQKESFPRYAEFIFELQGGVNPVELTEGGERVAKRITVKVTMPEPGKQPNEKSGYYKLFSVLNYDDSARHPSQLLGKHWLADVQQDQWTPPGQKDPITTANLGNAMDRFYLDKPAMMQGDPLAGAMTEVPIPLPERVSALRLFLWDFPSKPMWDSLFIDGEYPERKDDKGVVTSPAKSKNVIQAKIKSAQDWVGSPMQEILTEGELELPSTAAPAAAATGGAAADPLAGMV